MDDSKQNWHDVPNNLVRLYVKYADDALEAALADPKNPVGWEIQTVELGPVMVKRAGLDAVWKNLGLEEGLFPAIGRWGRGAQKLLGGPNPLTAMLLGSGLGAGLGYLGGAAGHALLPDYVGRHAGRNMAMLGALGGAVVPGAIHLPSAWKHYGLSGLFRSQPLQGGQDYPVSQPVTQPAGTKPPVRTPLAIAAAKKPTDPTGYWDKWGANDRFDEMLKQAAEEFHIKLAYGSTGVNYDYVTDAIVGANSRAGGSVGGGAIGDLPVDQWGRVVMRDPYLDNTEKAVAAGLPAIAGAAKGSNLVSPMDIARVTAGTAWGAGVGAGLGLLAKAVFDATPKAVKGIQGIGMLAGGIKSLLGIM